MPWVDVVTDLLTAKEKGEHVCKEFISNRLEQECITMFFDTLPQLKLKSFDTSKGKKVLEKGKVILKADKNLFSMMTVISQSRNLDERSSGASIRPYSIATCI